MSVRTGSAPGATHPGPLGNLVFCSSSPSNFCYQFQRVSNIGGQAGPGPSEPGLEVDTLSWVGSWAEHPSLSRIAFSPLGGGPSEFLTVLRAEVTCPDKLRWPKSAQV